MSKISVIVPLYNNESFIEECIESILKQTYSNFEIIIVDDGSTDNSLEKAYEIAKKSNKIQVYHMENSGVSSARNYGISKASGEYISFVDSDDKLKENFLCSLYNEMIKNKVDLVMCSYSLLYKNKIVVKSPRISTGEYLKKDFAHKALDDGSLSGVLFGSVCCCLYNANIVKNNNIKFDCTIKVNEDGLFNLQYIDCIEKIFVLNENLYIYRIS